MNGLSRYGFERPTSDLWIARDASEVPGQIQDPQIRVLLTQPPRELVAFHLRHHLIGNQQVDRTARPGRRFERLRPAGGLDDVEARVVEKAPDELANRRFVVGDENSQRLLDGGPGIVALLSAYVGSCRSGRLSATVLHRPDVGVCPTPSRQNRLHCAQCLRRSEPPRQSLSDDRLAERPLRRLLEDAQDMVYRYRLSPSRGTEYVAGAVGAITGHTAAEFYADPDLVTRALHPDDATLLGITQPSRTRVSPVTVRGSTPMAESSSPSTASFRSATRPAI